MSATSPAPSRPRRRSKGAVGERGHGWFLLPGLVLFTAVIVLPLLMNTWTSFTSWTGVGTPEWTGLSNYERLFRDATFWASFRHSLAIIVAMVVIPTALGLLLASVLFDVVSKRFGERTSAAFRAGFYLPQVLPVAVAGVVWGWIVHPDDGALDAALQKVGLGSLSHDWLGDPSTALATVMAVMVWFQLGYPLVIFMAGLARVDPELHEAAQLDGASWFQRFRLITIHLIKPEVFVVTLTTTIAALKVFPQIFVLTRGGPGDATIVPSYFAYQNFFEKADVGYGSAIATVLTVVIIAISAVFLRYQARSEQGGDA
ncbi:raffinose/stachyose/melibiose transport system permease protein [Motilibacter rhizosphaerae]|uniref:Raffinose/stachyose/melibiose transport system permease protein n=1 Tax=Motilibacter rhizosphaerae TaxID=598652 RepID=A0A4Q7NHP6_9ACTN|nr:sugar ABC transporter permease [Motilibacter rhizosphaerae]RZS82976.1 raffinose/stachyose/melibiose transport system permease protein [Motilibacter rhizosphaerae]